MLDVTEKDLSRILFDTVDLGIALLDCDHRVIAWNAWLASATAISADVAAGRPFEDLFPHIGANQLARRRDCFARVGHVAPAEPLAAPGAPAAKDPLGPGHDPRRDGPRGRLPASPLLSDSGF